MRSLANTYELKFRNEDNDPDAACKLAAESPEIMAFRQECRAATEKAFKSLPSLPRTAELRSFPCSGTECHWVVRGDYLVYVCHDWVGECELA